MTDPLDDLCGPPPKKPVPPSPELERALSALLTRKSDNLSFARRPGRPTLEDSEKLKAERESIPAPKMRTVEEIRQNGVPISWLAAMFRMEHETTRRRLQGCPEVGRARGNTPMYDFVMAAAYLVKPKFDPKTLRKGDLPPELQDSVWSARLKEQKYRKLAGDLWRTSDVQQVFSETALLIKNTVQLWTEDDRLSRSLTDEQRAALILMCDGLQANIHEALLKQATEKATPSQIVELDEEDWFEGLV